MENYETKVKPTFSRWNRFGLWLDTLSREEYVTVGVVGMLAAGGLTDLVARLLGRV